MQLSKTEIIDSFKQNYPHFVAFIGGPEWEKCMEGALDPELLSHVVFCNDIFQIPPVKTFLAYYENYFHQFCSEGNGLDSQLKKSIGAFWGNVFKFVIKDNAGRRIYHDQKNIYVGISDFKVTTATYFIK